MRISDWSSDVCSSDLEPVTQSAVDIQAFAWLSNDRIVVASRPGQIAEAAKIDAEGRTGWHYDARITPEYGLRPQMPANIPRQFATIDLRDGSTRPATADERSLLEPDRSEEHTSELQSLMRISHAVLCLTHKNKTTTTT